jgi:hypothetical protein
MGLKYKTKIKAVLVEVGGAIAVGEYHRFKI